MGDVVGQQCYQLFGLVRGGTAAHVVGQEPESVNVWKEAFRLLIKRIKGNNRINRRSFGLYLFDQLIGEVHVA